VPDPNLELRHHPDAEAAEDPASLILAALAAGAAAAAKDQANNALNDTYNQLTALLAKRFQARPTSRPPPAPHRPGGDPQSARNQTRQRKTLSEHALKATGADQNLHLTHHRKVYSSKPTTRCPHGPCPTRSEPGGAADPHPLDLHGPCPTEPVGQPEGQWRWPRRPPTPPPPRRPPRRERASVPTSTSTSTAATTNAASGQRSRAGAPRSPAPQGRHRGGHACWWWSRASASDSSSSATPTEPACLTQPLNASAAPSGTPPTPSRCRPGGMATQHCGRPPGSTGLQSSGPVECPLHAYRDPEP
jgi:hypothetical protein